MRSDSDHYDIAQTFFLLHNHPPSVLWHCWLGHQTCKNRRPYKLYCVGADVRPCSINQSTYCI